jgi:hypothetical protein
MKAFSREEPVKATVMTNAEIMIRLLEKKHLQLHFDCLGNFMLIFHGTNYIRPFYLAQQKQTKRANVHELRVTL